MIADIFWIKERYPGRIALVARPRGGEWLEEEVASWAKAGISTVVSMLEPEEIEAFELEREAEFSLASNIEFVSFPVPDRGVPVLDRRFRALIEALKTTLTGGRNIGIHCRQSVGRAPLLAAAIMTSLGVGPDEAFRRLGIARNREVPETTEQSEWVKSFAQENALALT